MDDTKPHFDSDGTLVIPFECSDHAYKYWKQEGKPLTEILKELGTDEETWARYTHIPFPTGDSGEPEGSDGDAEG